MLVLKEKLLKYTENPRLYGWLGVCALITWGTPECSMGQSVAVASSAGKTWLLSSTLMLLWHIPPTQALLHTIFTLSWKQNQQDNSPWHKAEMLLEGSEELNKSEVLTYPSKSCRSWSSQASVGCAGLKSPIHEGPASAAHRYHSTPSGFYWSPGLNRSRLFGGSNKILCPFSTRPFYLPFLWAQVVLFISQTWFFFPFCQHLYPLQGGLVWENWAF